MPGHITRWFLSGAKWRATVAAAAGLLGCYALSQYNYVLFHALVELSALVIACAVFLLFWNARRFLDNGFYLFIATACLVAGVLDLTHVLTFTGVSILPGLGASESFQAETAGRWTVALSFLVAPLFLRRRINPAVTLAAYGAGLALALAIIFRSGALPKCVVPEVGVTSCGQLSRGLGCAIFLAAAGLLARKRKELDGGVFRLLFGALLASSASELASAIAVGCEGALNAFGHLCQAVSLYFIYKALVEVGLTKPYDVLFRNQACSLRRLEGVNRLQEELILPAPLEEKFKKVTEAAVDLLDLDFCRIWSVLPGDLFHATTTDEEHLCRRRDRCLHLMASSGRYTDTDGAHRRVPLGCYKIGRIATGEDRKFLTNSVTNDPRVHNHEWAKRLGLVSFAGYKLNDARGKATGVLAMFARHPISEEDNAFLSHLAETTSKVIMDHLAEVELRQAQKLEGVGQLAGGVAHEFNNLLQVIHGYTSAGMEGLRPEEERYADLSQVRKAAERAAALTRQLLGFSRRRAIEPRSTDANLVVRDLVKLIRPAIGEQISLELALGDDVGRVYADAGELQQALLNLCLNARDAMPCGGTLMLKTEKAVVAEPFWDAHFDIKPGTYVVFSVSDTGCGIPRDIQQRIFEPFFTTKEVGKGTGLGLALVYGVVRQHKGAIHLYSEVGVGTTFKLYLPPGEGDAEEDFVEEAGPALHGTETILVAEDEPMVRKLTVRTLERAGYTVLAAADGEEALRMFEENRGAISLLVLDAIMPKLTGHEVHRRIKEVSPGTRVVCCTGYDREIARSDCLVRDNVPLIQKPFTARTLLSTVRQVLDAGKGVGSLLPEWSAGGFAPKVPDPFSPETTC